MSRVIGLRANTEGLKLGSGVLEKLANEGEKGSLRYVFQSLYTSSVVLIISFVSLVMLFNSSHLPQSLEHSLADSRSKSRTSAK
jgi:DNA helicase TIP49 (TBP-interacting protein)